MVVFSSALSSSGTFSCGGSCIDIRCSIMGDNYSWKRSSGKGRALVAAVGAVVAGYVENEPLEEKGSILLYHPGSLVAKSCIICIIPTAKSSVLRPVR